MCQRLQELLFFADPGRWLGVLRVGLGSEVLLYSWSLQKDWRYFYSSGNYGSVNRQLAEAVLSGESLFTPRLGWFVTLGKIVGLSEPVTLSLLWLILVTVSLGLVLGFCCRGAAIAGWLFFLSSVKSGNLISYGVDNFTTIGLFYLMIAPLPDRWSLDWKLGKEPPPNPIRLGFHRRVLQLHLCLIYFFSGISKSLCTDWWNGNSVWQALTRPPFYQVAPSVLLRFEYLLPAAGVLVCLLETGYPLLIWPRQTRSLWLTGILLLHLSIGLSMGLYLFSLVMIVLNLAAFGPEFFIGARDWTFSYRKQLATSE